MGAGSPQGMGQQGAIPQSAPGNYGGFIGKVGNPAGGQMQPQAQPQGLGALQNAYSGFMNQQPPQPNPMFDQQAQNTFQQFQQAGAQGMGASQMPPQTPMAPPQAPMAPPPPPPIAQYQAMMNQMQGQPDNAPMPMTQPPMQQAPMQQLPSRMPQAPTTQQVAQEDPRMQAMRNMQRMQAMRNMQRMGNPSRGGFR